ncbi:unnamed protein product [Prorocentrum cordatum]|uniref:Pyruvate kinase n=1 Tax=Prorocentrum cordatum TaxID=2364126 RepID=A0ABN9QQK2_9DINO|nr:unnamed protein product [Polarella glacialis]
MSHLGHVSAALFPFPCRPRSNTLVAHLVSDCIFLFVFPCITILFRPPHPPLAFWPIFLDIDVFSPCNVLCAEVYNSKKVLEAGQEFKLVTDYSVKGDENHVAITYSRLPKDIKVGQQILVQDGTVILDVTSTGDDFVMCKVRNKCKLGEKKNVNVPGVKIDLPVVDEREIKDIKEWAIPSKADYIALSFVQCAQDILDCRRSTAAPTSRSEGEDRECRGHEKLRRDPGRGRRDHGCQRRPCDLGMEIPMEKIWMAQKWMIKKAKEAGKIVVTATEMLASMEERQALPHQGRGMRCRQRSVGRHRHGDAQRGVRQRRLPGGVGDHDEKDDRRGGGEGNGGDVSCPRPQCRPS